MYVDGGRLILSPSDLVDFLQCGHLTELSLEVADGTRAKPTSDSQGMSVVQRRGIEHEKAHLARLHAEGLDIAEISESGELDMRAELTRKALAAGPDVIYQATFIDRATSGPFWRGHADFLTRVAGPSSLGPFSYEPEDTKLASHVRPSAVLQLCEYAEQLARCQGRVPDHVHVVLTAAADGQVVRKLLKRWLGQSLAGHVPLEPEQTFWAECVSVKWVWADDYFGNVVQYVHDQRATRD